MKYIITRRCGHKETITLFGKVANRGWKLRKEEGKLCYNCYLAEMAAKSAAAAQAAKESGLPQLIGSERQVAWAEVIRQKAMAHIENMRHEALDPEVPQNVREAALAFLDKIASTQDAAYWINQREWLAGSEQYFQFIFMDRLHGRMKA